MAAPSVTFDGTRVDDGDALGSIWTDLGGGKAASEPDFVYQGVAAVSEKIGTTAGGVALDMVATVDYTAPLVWIAKVIATNSAALNVKGATGGILEIGSGGLRADYDRYYVVGSDTYPLLGGWLIIPIDPNGGNQSARPGAAPTLTAIDYYGWECDFVATSKAENVAMDAVDYIAYGEGLTLVGGDGVSADGVFQDFIDFDEDAAAASNNRYGIVSTREGVLYVTGFLNIGTATETDFDDTGAVIVWPDAEFLGSAGFFGLGVSLANASSVVTITNCVFISRGTVGGTVDTRADMVVTNTSGTLTLDGCRFANMRTFVLTSAATVTGCDIEAESLTQATAEIDSSTIRTTSLTSVAAITDPTFGVATGIHDCDFVQAGAGHALELSTVGATVNLTNITFAGYGADTTDAAAIDVTAATGTTTINWSGGTAPSYKTAGATVLVVNAVTVAVTVKAASDTSDIENARVLLTESAKDTVTITRSGAVATVTHTAHGYATGDDVLILGADQDEYNGIQAITVTTVNAYTYTVGGTPVTGTGTISAQLVILDGLTSVAGLISDTGFNYVSDIPVSGRARKSTATPYYKTAAIAGTIAIGGFSTTVFLLDDE